MIFSMDIIFFDIDIEEVIFFILGKITIFCLRWLWRSDLRSPGQNWGRWVTFNFSHDLKNASVYELKHPKVEQPPTASEAVEADLIWPTSPAPMERGHMPISNLHILCSM